MKEPLIRKERIRMMIALMLAFVLCASAVSAFAEDDEVNSAGTEQTETAASEEPEQTGGSGQIEQIEEEPEQTGDPAQNNSDPAADESDNEQADGTEQKEDKVVKAAPGLRASNEAVIEYGSREIAKSRQFWSTDGTYIGCCCQAGTPPASSGAASMSKVANTSLVARIAYYYGHGKGWLLDYKVIPGFQEHTNAARFMYMVQMSQQGTTAWTNWAAANNFSKKVRDDAVAVFNAAQKLEITVPDGFECYICSPVNGSQKFILFRYNEASTPGAVTVRKISGNTDITG